MTIVKHKKYYSFIYVRNCASSNKAKILEKNCRVKIKHDIVLCADREERTAQSSRPRLQCVLDSAI